MGSGGDDEGGAEPEQLEATEVAPSYSPGRSPSVGERLARREQEDPRAGLVLLGRYRLEQAIAKGGMGKVYRGTQLKLNRPIAVKVLNREFKETDPQFVRRFCLEAEISARISHPNVVTVHDYGETEDGELFIVMEYLRGRTLSQLIQQEAPLPAARIIRIATQLARALREAHAQGIIHRDLKPGNVMLLDSGDEPDVVKVLDFGLVKRFVPEGRPVGVSPEQGEDFELTLAGTLLGSPRYMSPEQIKGEVLDPRTDIYSLGIILFQMAAGRPPFTGAGNVDLIYKHVHEPVPSIASVSNGVDCPPELERIIDHALEKDRDRRYGSMGELIEDLKRARDSITEAGPRLPAQVESAVRTELLPAIPEEPTKESVPLPTTRIPAAATVLLPPTLAPTPVSEVLSEPKTVPTRGAEGRASLRGPLIAGVALTAVIALALAALLQSRRQAGAVPPAPGIPAKIDPHVPIDSTPSGAQVRLDGVPICKTPCALERPAEPEGQAHALEVELEGYTVLRAPLRFGERSALSFELEPALPIEVEASPEPSPMPEGADPEAKYTGKRRTKRLPRGRNNPDEDWR